MFIQLMFIQLMFIQLMFIQRCIACGFFSCTCEESSIYKRVILSSILPSCRNRALCDMLLESVLLGPPPFLSQDEECAATTTTTGAARGVVRVYPMKFYRVPLADMQRGMLTLPRFVASA
jgi:hypothetical protein